MTPRFSDNKPKQKKTRSTSKSSPPDKKATLADIARVAGLSKAAVSAFLTGNLYAKDKVGVIGVSKASQEKILKAGRELGYESPEYAVQVKLYPETADVCLMISSRVSGGFSNPYFSRILMGALSARSAHSGQVILSTFDADADYLKNPGLLPRSVRNCRVSSVLLVGTPNDSLLEKLTEYNIQVTYLSREVGEHHAHVRSVVADYQQAGALAVDYLWGKGHQNFEVVCGDYMAGTNYQTINFSAGINSALASRARAFSLNDLHFTNVNSAPAARQFLKKLLKEKQPTALFCLDDFCAMQLWEAANALGLHCPDDLSILGCNDDTRSSALSDKLTTIHLPAGRIGKIAIKEMERTLLEPEYQQAKCIKLPVKLVERISVQAPVLLNTGS